MKKILILAIAVSLIVAGIALATVISSKHDLRPAAGPGLKAGAATNTNQVCVFCHHPHRGPSALGVTSLLLWNVNRDTSTYPTWTTYTSPTMDGVTVGDTMGAIDRQTSIACLSCHDGVVGMGSVVRQPSTGTIVATDIGIPERIQLDTINFTDDHPVDFTYPETDAEIAAPAAITATYPLDSGILRCTTCHDVHNVAYPAGQIQFLRGTMLDSGMCRDCHLCK